MSIFSNINQTEAYSEEQRQYFLPGHYRVQINHVYTKPKRLGGHLFIAETTVLGSDCADIKIGEKRNWVQSMELPGAMPRVKVFVGAAKGYSSKFDADRINAEVTEALCEEVVSKNNPLNGTELNLECYQKRSEKTGRDFTIHMWNPVNEH